jgi:ferredoxin
VERDAAEGILVGAPVSRFTTLHPGDLIITGSPPGSGIMQKPPVFLQVGDEVSASIGPDLGELRNIVTAAPPHQAGAAASGRRPLSQPISSLSGAGQCALAEPTVFD